MFWVYLPKWEWGWRYILGIWHYIIYEKESVLDCDTVLYPSCPGLWCCIISQNILPWVMMLHHIPEERRPQPHSCGNLRTQKIRNLNVAIIFLLLTSINELDGFISLQGTRALWTAAQMQKAVLGGLWRMPNICAKNSALWTFIGSVLLYWPRETQVSSKSGGWTAWLWA